MCCDDEQAVGGANYFHAVVCRYCADDVCPADKGQCRAARGSSGDDYVTVSKCDCIYGFGGEACAQRVVSYVALLWQVRNNE